MEEKKKATSAKKTSSTTKKSTTKKTPKTSASKKATTTKTTPKKTTTKKATTKKATTTKKVAPKKIEPTKEEVKKEAKTVETIKEEALEKTIIFNSQQKRNLKEVVDKLDEETVVVDDKVIKRSIVRKYLIIIIAVAMVLVAAASIAYIASQQKTARHSNETTGSNIYEKAKAKKIEPVEKADEEVETEEKYEHIITIDLKKFETKAANKDEMIVLVASSSCGSCIQFEPDVEKVFAELNKNIYRIDIKSMTEEEINTFREYYAFTITPTIFVVKDGVVVADTARTGRMQPEELKEWLNKNS